VTQLQENQAGNLIVPLAIGAVIAGGVLWWATQKKSEDKATTPQLPPAVKCVVSQEGLGKWGMTVNMTAIHVPMLGIEDPVSPSLAIDILPSEIGNKLKALPSNEQVVLVDKNDVFHYFANKSSSSVRRDDLQADYCNKVGGTLAGHPTDLFMF